MQRADTVSVVTVTFPTRPHVVVFEPWQRTR